MNKNILIFTGDGKGKSTSSFGMALRAVGHNHRVLIIQFIKSDDSVGELVSLKKLGICVTQTGLGFVPGTDDPHYPEHQNAAQLGFTLAKKAINSGLYDLIILDELCVAIDKGLVEEKAVLTALRDAPEPLNIVLTGRNATDQLIELADTVSEIEPLKHAYNQGITAREGVEY